MVKIAIVVGSTRPGRNGEAVARWVHELARHWLGTRWGLGAPQTSAPGTGKVNCGTFVGTGLRLRHEKPEVKLISVQPDTPLHGLEGLKHMETAIVPGIYDPALADEDMRVSTEDAYTMVRRLAREEGLLVGISGGAAVAGALKVARNTRNAVIVTIFPDSADKYMSERFWNAPS